MSQMTLSMIYPLLILVKVMLKMMNWDSRDRRFLLQMKRDERFSRSASEGFEVSSLGGFPTEELLFPSN